MKNSLQQELFSRDISGAKREVEYVPLDAGVIKDYTHALCVERQCPDADYRRSEVTTGLASFLTFVAERMAKYLNEGHEAALLARPAKQQQNK